MLQRTLAKPIDVTGVGLYPGERVAPTLHPAAKNSSIAFRRTGLDGKQGEIIRLSPYLTNDTCLSSAAVTEDGVRIDTIEHVIPALSAYSVNNYLTGLNVSEIPIMDGSNLPSIYLLQDAGTINRKTQKRFLKILKPVEIKEVGRWVRFTPYDDFKVTLTIEFGRPVFNRSAPTLEVDFAGEFCIDEIIRARIFGFVQEVELIRAHNLGLGGNLGNAIVTDDTDVLNPEDLRYSDELIRHKILDAVGDLHIVDHPVIDAFESYKSDHAISNALSCAILTDESCYEWVESPNDAGLPSALHELPSVA